MCAAADDTQALDAKEKPFATERQRLGFGPLSFSRGMVCLHAAPMVQLHG